MSQTFTFDLRGQKVDVTIGERATGDFTASYLSLMGLGEILSDADVTYIAGAAQAVRRAGLGDEQPRRPDAEPDAALPGGQHQRPRLRGPQRAPTARSATPPTRAIPELTADEFYLLILNIDMGGQFFFRENLNTAGSAPRNGDIDMHTNKTMKLAVVTFLGISLAAAGTAVAGRGSSPQAVQRAIASGSPDAIKSELERAEHLVCVSCVDMVMPLIDNQQPGHPAGRGLVARAAWCRADRPGRDAEPAGAARLDRRAQRGGRAGRVPLRVVDPGAVGGAVEPGVLERGAGAHGAGAGPDLAAGGGGAADGGAGR